MRRKSKVKVVKTDFIKVNISIDYFIYVGKFYYEIHLQFAIKGFDCQKRETTILRNFMFEAPRLISLVLVYTVFSEALDYVICMIYLYFVFVFLVIIICINLESALGIG